ncbi:MAG: bifunctional DNA-formamidopyrimidine glycosylase/DNA-(apurinic or apyrimidinic site) lyase [Pelagibacterales bacterium]|nr:bifunctional DNA-formamidopyrimidine glycosylase/DNA-(apurinic or apyrimidinic site) lyase [Pelagibacterales bacterium]
MPELPEVETVTTGLNFAIKNLIVKKVYVGRYDLRITVAKKIKSVINNVKVVGVKRRAKYGIIKFDNHYSIIFHLGMSGSIVIERNNFRPLQKHDHIAIEFIKKNNSKLRFIFKDPRRFGFFNIYHDEDNSYKNIFKNLGPEPLIKEFSVQSFYENLNKKQSSIKSLLLNQSIISGLGNIYVCESLFLAQISPFALGCELSLKDIIYLYSKIEKVLKKAIKEGGTTLKDYKNISGEIGYFQNYLSVYNRENNKCVNNCSSLIKRNIQNGRSTYYCPNCQK